MTAHVVLGTGQVGSQVIGRLVELERDVVAVNHSGRGTYPGATVIGGDITDPEFAASVLARAEAVYFCLNPASYGQWPSQFPPLQRAVVNAISGTATRLVVLENLYAYGPTGGHPMTESMPTNPSSAKSATRAAMTADLLRLHARGDICVTIGRAADLVGPGVAASSLGEQVFRAAVDGRRALAMGRPDTVHSYSYVADVGHNLVELGSHADAYGQIWHLPNPPLRTTRDIVDQIFRTAGNPPRLQAVHRPLLRTIGLVHRPTRDLLATYYQFDEPFIVDDSAFRTAFPAEVTSWDEIIPATVDWYRQSGRR